MFGNSTGWYISAGIALFMGFMLKLVVMPPAPTEATYAGVFTVVQKPLALPTDPYTIIPRGTGSGDAGALYRKAIADYDRNPDPYELAPERIMKTDMKTLVALDDIVKARECGSCDLFKGKPSELINYDNAVASLEALDTVGKACYRVGLLYTNEKYNAKTRPDDALKLWEGAFVLGEHMYDERLTWDELARGLGLMSTAAINLRNYYTDIKKDEAKVAALDKFISDEAEYQAKLLKAFQLIQGVEESTVGQYAGDIFAMAAAKPGTPYAAADSMWRVEAIKHVGKYRFNVDTDRKGDQLAARRVLSKMVDDASLSPPVKAAATAAHDLTIEKYHAFG